VARRFELALAVLLSGAAAAAVDSLQLLRVDALETLPAAAAALGEAVRALRGGGDATRALLAARRAIAGDAVAAAGLPAWSEAW
jgi:hypothetical protein